jgi:MerR family transcriptional regulator, light-induced transcriptional regulator
MASVYGIVRSLAKVGSPVPRLRNFVGRKPVADAVPTKPSGPPAFAALVESEIIPRLMIAHGRDGDDHNSRSVVAPRAEPVVGYHEAKAFAPLAITMDARELLDHVEVFVGRGVSIDTIFVELLAPAARHLGEMWDEDEADFVAVTMGLWRLQEVVRELSSRVPVRGSAGQDHVRTALFAVMPGDDHSFGTVIVEDVFRRAGWATDLMTDTSTSTLLAMVARNSYDLIGLTVSGTVCADDAPSLINAVRSVSRNPFVGIMVGGSLFNVAPQLATDIGADATAPDALKALEVASELVDGLIARSEFCV